MLSHDVLSRLSQLNRAGIPVGAPGVAPPTLGSASSDSGRSETEKEDLSRLPPGTEVENLAGRHWLRERELAQLWPNASPWLSHEMARLSRTGSSSKPLPSELRALLDALPDHVVYLDLETCGFAGSMIFLVGLIHQRGGRFFVSQLLARNYSEEKPLLQTLWTMAADKRVLATFNGKSFDWPMVHDRSTLHRLGRDPRMGSPQDPPQRLAERELMLLGRDDPRPDLIHCDLLHHARRRWRKKLPDCRLQTLERYVCRRRREGDIAGREIPSAYHDFVRSGDAWLIRSVLHHNALDLITLLQLSICVARS
jgi:uncharacterized protein YprB with RNaseH-like and TPR domain